MKGIIHYKVFDLGMIYSPFPELEWEMENGNLPWDKLRIHLLCSKDIKGMKLCIEFIVGMRTTKKKAFYQTGNFHNRVRDVRFYDPGINGSFGDSHSLHVYLLCHVWLPLIWSWCECLSRLFGANITNTPQQEKVNFFCIMPPPPKLPLALQHWTVNKEHLHRAFHAFADETILFSLKN